MFSAGLLLCASMLVAEVVVNELISCNPAFRRSQMSRTRCSNRLQRTGSIDGVRYSYANDGDVEVSDQRLLQPSASGNSLELQVRNNNEIFDNSQVWLPNGAAGAALLNVGSIPGTTDTALLLVDATDSPSTTLSSTDAFIGILSGSRGSAFVNGENANGQI